MPVRRFVLDTPPSGGVAMLEEREAHHLIHVLRAEMGTGVELTDGRGRLWSARVGEISGNRVRLVDVSLLSEAAEPQVRLKLVQALCKSDRLTWILQKATELEVSEIYLVQGRRSLVRISPERRRAKLERWRTILVNAAKQCRRSTIPTLYPPLECREVCEAVESDLKLLLQASPRAMPLKRLLRGKSWSSVAFAVGPEGGWTGDECETFLRSGFQAVQVGLSTLRTETAATVAAALLRYELFPEN
ncbi:MAG: RsmE family RNA methyltransferase [Acidobacteria bacterium]|nr:RsmE family RNA methyltransferase [Acidobacteriota bacterium]